MKFALLVAAALAAAALVTSAKAQEVIYNPGRCAQFYPNANCQNLGPNNPYTGDYQRRRAYRTSANRNDGNWENGWNNNNWNNGWHHSWNDNRWQRHDSGFWPGDVATNAVGGAVGTAAGLA